ncbi:MAG: TonB-dependent receptor [Planctomycetes bacterium]|nr:TonB-dependent receptor [Planctomycetota bacterium]
MPLCIPQAPPLPSETFVTAPRSTLPATVAAAAVVVLTAEDLARTGERSLPRMIEKASGAGVWLQETNLGGGAPILRGFIGEKVLIVVDGVRLNDATTRLGPNQSLNTIDPGIVERVEIVRGAGSVQYGSDAVGGTILIWTKRRLPGSVDAQGTPDGFDAGIETQYQSVNTGVRVAPSVGWSTDRNGFLATGSFSQWNELRSADGDIDNTGYDSGALFGSWNHAVDRWRSVRLTASAHRDWDVPRTDRLNVGFGQAQPSSAEFTFERQDQRQILLAFEDAEPGGFADRFQARLGLRGYEERRRQRNTGSTQRRLEEDEILAPSLGLDWRKAIGEHHLVTFGLDVEYDDVDSSRTNVNINTGASAPGQPTFAPDSSYLATGVFVQDEISALDPLDVTVGLRYSFFHFGFDQFTSGPAGGPHESGDFDALTAALGLGYDLAEGWRATAGVAQGFRAPHLDDLARNGTIFGGTELANPDLDPEQSLTVELGLEHARGPWKAAIAGYATFLDDAIGRRLVDEGDPGTLGDETYLRDNTGRVEIYGVELRAERRLGAEGSPFALRGGIAWATGRQYDDTLDPATGEAPYDDVPARRIPPLNGYVALAYDSVVPAWSWLTWAELRLTLADAQDDLNPDDLSDPRIDPDGTESWGRVDLDLGGPLGKHGGSRWNLGLHNLLDEAYRVHGSGLDAPGFGVVVGVAWMM